MAGYCATPTGVLLLVLWAGRALSGCPPTGPPARSTHPHQSHMCCPLTGPCALRCDDCSGAPVQCRGERCLVSCTRQGSCGSVSCLDSSFCDLQCEGERSCMGFWDCGGKTCTTQCRGQESCRGHRMQCMASEVCMLNCAEQKACHKAAYDCSEGECTVKCGASLACSESKLHCTADRGCTVMASGALAFSMGTLDCGGHRCTLQCDGKSSCSKVKASCESRELCKVDCRGENSCLAANIGCRGAECRVACAGEMACSGAIFDAQQAHQLDMLCSHGGCAGVHVTCAVSCNIRCSGRGCDGASFRCPDGAACRITCRDHQACSAMRLQGDFDVQCETDDCGHTKSAVLGRCTQWEVTAKGREEGLNATSCHRDCVPDVDGQVLASCRAGLEQTCRCVSTTKRRGCLEWVPLPDAAIPPTACRACTAECPFHLRSKCMCKHPECRVWRVTRLGEVEGTSVAGCESMCKGGKGGAACYGANALCSCDDKVGTCSQWVSVGGEEWCAAQCEATPFVIAPQCTARADGRMMGDVCRCSTPIVSCTADSACQCPVGGACTMVCPDEKRCTNASFNSAEEDTTVVCAGYASCVGSRLGCERSRGKCRMLCFGDEACAARGGQKAPAVRCGVHSEGCDVRCAGHEGCREMTVACSSKECLVTCSQQLACQGMHHTCQGRCDSTCTSRLACQGAWFDWRQGGKGSLLCSNVLSCKNAVVRCPKDDDCLVTCSGRQSCDGLRMECPTKASGSKRCSLVCEDELACRGVVVTGDHTTQCATNACPSSLREPSQTALRLQLRLTSAEFAARGVGMLREALKKVVPDLGLVTIGWVCPASRCRVSYCIDRTNCTRDPAHDVASPEGVTVEFTVNSEWDVATLITHEMQNGDALLSLQPQAVRELSKELFSASLQSLQNPDEGTSSNSTLLVALIVAASVAAVLVAVIAVIRWKARPPSDMEPCFSEAGSPKAIESPKGQEQ
eukprot:Sspe_Gene.78117::Locus_48866_Transcript_1_1_Confidence_1.000_Length_2955::g.78117::m.78117